MSNAEIVAAATANADPEGLHAQSLVARWRELINAFTGGDAGIEKSLHSMYNDPNVSPVTMPKPPPPDSLRSSTSPEYGGGVQSSLGVFVPWW